MRIEQPLVVPGGESLPEPNLAVVARGPKLTSHPSTALLVVEIAISSPATDTTVKPALYCAAGIPDYWVVDVAGRRVEVRCDPVGNEYRRLDVLEPGEAVAAPALEVPPLDLAAFFAVL